MPCIVIHEDFYIYFPSFLCKLLKNYSFVIKNISPKGEFLPQIHPLINRTSIQRC